jgi:hypothetical protein
VRLLLDTHHSRRAAERLRAMGHDGVAASDDPTLAALPDDDLLRAAARDRRAVVTENAKDVDRIARTWAGAGEHHRGIVFTSPRRFARNRQSSPADLVRALATLLEDPPADDEAWTLWLP